MPLGQYSRFSALLAGSQLRRNLSTSAAVNVLNMTASVLSFPIYLRYLSLQEYGVWLALSAVITLVQLGGFGINPAITKFIAQEKARGDEAAVQSYASTALALLTVSGAALALAAAGLRTTITDMLRVPPESYAMARGVVPLVALLSAYTFIAQVPAGVLAGLGRQDQVSYVLTAGRIVTLIIAWLMLARGLGIASLIVSGFSGQIAGHVWMEVLIRRISPRCRFSIRTIDSTNLGRLVRFGAAMMGAGLVQMILHPFNRIMLSRYGGVSLLPTFEVAYSGSMQFRSVFASAMPALLPEFSRVDALRDYGRARDLNRRIQRLIWAGALPLHLMLVIVAPFALRLWLRSGFSDGQVLPFRLMIVGAFVSLLGVPAYYYLIAIARVNLVLGSHILQSGANAILVLAFLASSRRIAPVQLSVSVSLGFVAASAWLMYWLNRAMLQRGQGRTPDHSSDTSCESTPRP